MQDLMHGEAVQGLMQMHLHSVGLRTGAGNKRGLYHAKKRLSSCASSGVLFIDCRGTRRQRRQGVWLEPIKSHVAGYISRNAHPGVAY